MNQTSAGGANPDMSRVSPAAIDDQAIRRAVER